MLGKIEGGRKRGMTEDERLDGISGHEIDTGT